MGNHPCMLVGGGGSIIKIQTKSIAHLFGIVFVKTISILYIYIVSWCIMHRCKFNCQTHQTSSWLSVWAQLLSEAIIMDFVLGIWQSNSHEIKIKSPVW